MGALIKKTEARSGRHIFEASGPSLPFPNCQSGGGIARHCTLLPPQSSKLAGMSLYGRLCCKSLLNISAGNIDSRSSANTQRRFRRFKRTGVPIRLFQISISQSPLGDFCNTIGPKAKLTDVRSHVSFQG